MQMQSKGDKLGSGGDSQSRGRGPHAGHESITRGAARQIKWNENAFLVPRCKRFTDL